MKQAFALTIILLMASGFVLKAQTEKGKFFVAGSNRLELNIGGEKQKVDGDLVEGSEISYFDFDFQPRMGYTVIDNLVAGLFMDVDVWSNKSKDEDYGYTEKGTTFIIGPFVRFYFLDFHKLKPYAEAQVGFGIDHYKYKYNDDSDWNKTDESVFTYRIGGGATYFFNEFVGADAFLGFLHDSYKYKDSDDPERSEHNSKYIYNEFIMQLGIVVMLSK